MDLTNALIEFEKLAREYRYVHDKFTSTYRNGTVTILIHLEGSLTRVRVEFDGLTPDGTDGLRFLGTYNNLQQALAGAREYLVKTCERINLHE